MDDLYLPFAVMFVTLLVLANLEIMFRSWLADRDKQLKAAEPQLEKPPELQRAA